MQEKVIAAANKYINIFSVFLTAAVVILIRQPLFFTAPRLWAEEGGIYLFHALTHDPASSFLTPHLGYYSLFGKMAMYMASQILPLPFAASITTAFSAVLQLCTCLVIYASPGRLGRSKLHRYVLSLIPLFVAYPETWLNTINAHFWLATGTYFILNSARVNIAQIVYILVAFLTGGASLFFLPYFALRAAKEQTAELWSIVILGAAAAQIQFFSFYSFIEAGGNSRLKIEFLGNLAKGMLYTALLPLQQRGASFLLVILIAFAIYRYVKILISAQDRLGLLYSLVSLLTYTLLSVLVSLNMNGGSRYGLPVHCGLVAIAFRAFSLQKLQTLGDKIYAIFLAALVTLILGSFFAMDSVYSSAWPNWQQQLQSRRCDQTSEILTFPQWEGAKWGMIIPKGSGVECKSAPSLN